MKETKWTEGLPWDEITDNSSRFRLDDLLVAAIVRVESGGSPWVTRYEPHLTALNAPSTWAPKLRITQLTEEVGQKTSWGPMQVLGVTARDLGFTGYFPQLCSKDLGIEWGCKYLARQVRRYGTLLETIAAYNAGSAIKKNDVFINQDYVDKVMGLIGRS